LEPWGLKKTKGKKGETVASDGSFLRLCAREGKLQSDVRKMCEGEGDVRGWGEGMGMGIGGGARWAGHRGEKSSIP